MNYSDGSGKIYPSLLLAVLIVFHIANNSYWLSRDFSVSGIDVEHHLLLQLCFFDSFLKIIQNHSLSVIEKLSGIAPLFKEPILDMPVIWPHFVYFISSLFLLVQRSHLAAKLSMLVFFVILIFSTYGIGKKAADKKTGLMAAVIVSFYPMIFEGSRQYSLDFPLTAFVALSVFLLLQTRSFEDTRYSILCGLSFGVAMHIKIQHLFFTMPVLAVVAVDSFFRKRDQTKALLPKKIFNLILLALIAGGLSWIWWGDKISGAGAQMHLHLTNGYRYVSQAGLDPFSSSALSWYGKAIAANAVGPVFFLLFLTGTLDIAKPVFRHRAALIAWIIVPVLLFSFALTLKQSRYIMPVLPAMAVVSSCALSGMHGWFRYSAAALVLAFGLLQYAAISYYPLVFRHRTFIGKIRALAPSSYETSVVSKNFEMEKQLIEVMRREIPLGREVKVGYFPMVKGRMGHSIDAYWFKLMDPAVNLIGFWKPRFYESLDSYQFLLFVSASNVLPPLGRRAIQQTYPGILRPSEYKEIFGNETNMNYLVEIFSRSKQDFSCRDEAGFYWHLLKIEGS